MTRCIKEILNLMRMISSFDIRSISEKAFDNAIVLSNFNYVISETALFDLIGWIKTKQPDLIDTLTITVEGFYLIPETGLYELGFRVVK